MVYAIPKPEKNSKNPFRWGIYGGLAENSAKTPQNNFVKAYVGVN